MRRRKRRYYSKLTYNSKGTTYSKAIKNVKSYCNCYCPLRVDKRCYKDEENLLLKYEVRIYNLGRHTLRNINYLDKLTYDGNNVVIGNVTVFPSNIKINSETSGLLVLSGSFQYLKCREYFKIEYSVPIESITGPGIYNFDNMATVTSLRYKAWAKCSESIQIIEPCPQFPIINLACQTSDIYSVIQPKCQFTNTNESVLNPFYDVGLNTSYWTYQVVTNCTDNKQKFLNRILIPVFENISSNSIKVFERILSVDEFIEIPFSIVTATKDIHKTEKESEVQQVNTYIEITVDDRYTSGVAVLYQVQILGQYNSTEGTIDLVNDGGVTLPFSGQFLTPSEPTNPRLAVTKSSIVTIEDNRAYIDYSVAITNTGSTDLTNVFYEDIINYDTNITLGPITVSPSSVRVDTSQEGVILLTDNIPLLGSGSVRYINYRVPLIAFSAPNSYMFSSHTTAFNDIVRAAINTEVIIDAVDLTTINNCQVINEQQALFQIGVNNNLKSPATNFTLLSRLEIPNNITIQFEQIDICTATFGDGSTVPIDTDISGDTIFFTCSSSLPRNGMVRYNIRFRLISINAIASDITIVNSITDVFLTNANSQVFLGATPLPNVKELIANVDAMCLTPIK